ncbi:MAG: ferritin-like domain-containing protein [Bacteroidota bacterium]
MQNMNNGLRTFFIDSLQDIYYAEKHLVEALEKLEEKATTQNLKNAFAEHRDVTLGHVSRLEEVFSMLGEEAKTRKCEAIKGIIKEADEIIDETETDTLTRDAALILAAQKAEHYEIATYGTLATFARTLGEHQVASLLHETLEEEKEADEMLTTIAESFINEQAMQDSV